MTDRDDALRGLEGEVGVLIRRVRRVLADRSREIHPDLAPSSYFMLGYIGEHGPIRASVMIGVLGIDKAAISRQAQHLIDLGLVDRAPDPEDGRATLLRVSADGERRLKAVTSVRRKMLDSRLSDWTTDDLATLTDNLRRYNASLEPAPADQSAERADEPAR